MHKFFLTILIIIFTANLTALGKPTIRGTSLNTLTEKQKLKDLNTFCNTLEKKQPHLYKVVSKELFNQTKKEIKSKLSELNDAGFYYELQKLAALSRNAHTFVNNTPDSNIEKNFIPIQITEIDGKWFLTASFGKEYKQYLSNELTEINGHPIRDILELAEPYISYENKIRLENRFTQKINHADFLYHLGIIDDMKNIVFTTKNLKGKEIKFHVTTCSWDNLVNKEFFSIYKVPTTNPNSNKIYTFFPINEEVLFIRYNLAREDSNYPLSEFTKDLEKELNNKTYKKVIVDLRNNTGGNYTLFPPTIQKIKELKEKQNFKLYTLISDTTFSSGVIHAAQLQHDAGAILVGTPTSGNVYGYGDTDDAVELPNSHLEVIYSTKYKKLVEGYKADALYPDIYIQHTIQDYISGIDKDVETILND